MLLSDVWRRRLRRFWEVRKPRAKLLGGGVVNQGEKDHGPTEHSVGLRRFIVEFFDDSNLETVYKLDEARKLVGQLVDHDSGFLETRTFVEGAIERHSHTGRVEVGQRPEEADLLGSVERCHPCPRFTLARLDT